MESTILLAVILDASESRYTHARAHNTNTHMHGRTLLKVAHTHAVSGQQNATYKLPHSLEGEKWDKTKTAFRCI